jgi:hypothetical protein
VRNYTVLIPARARIELVSVPAADTALQAK